MDDNQKNTFDQAAAFQNMWMDSMAGMARVWGQYSPESPPPEELKKMRQGTLRVISQCWEEFMRTPQFMEMMRDSVNNGLNWQQYAKDGVNRMHDATQTATKTDIDGALLAIRHVEKRILDHVDDLQETLAKLQADLASIATPSRDKMDDAFQQELLRRLKSIEAKLKTPPPPAKKPSPKRK